VHDFRWSFSLPRDINSCLILPIKKSAKIIGTFSLYSAQLNFAGAEEIKLLIEVAGDSSFAHDLFKKEKKQTDSDEVA